MHWLMMMMISPDTLYIPSANWFPAVTAAVAVAVEGETEKKHTGTGDGTGIVRQQC